MKVNIKSLTVLNLKIGLLCECFSGNNLKIMQKRGGGVNGGGGLSVGLFLGLEQSFSESFTSPQGYQETRRDIQDVRITSFYCFYS